MKYLFKQNEKKARYIIVVFFGVLLTLLLLVLSFYNHPSADDYNYSVNVRQYGFFGAQYYWYINWSGRYFSTLLLSLNPLVLGSFMGYKLLSFFLIILGLVSFYYFINTLFHKSGLLEKLYIIFLCFFSFVLLMPSLAEAYYWMAGAYSYQIGNILTLFLFILMIRYKDKPSKTLFILSVIVVAALAGTNETSMFIIVLLLLVINIINLIRKRKIHFYYLILFALALVCALVVYFAPGNTVRALQTNNHQLLFSIKSATSEAMDVISNWWWIGVFIILTTYKIAADKILDKSENRFKSFYLNPFLVLVLIFVTIAAGFFTCFWSLGLYPPLRTINTIYFYFIIGSIYTGICIAVKLKKAGINVPDFPFAQILIPLCLAFYVYKYQNNISTAFFDLKDGVAVNYDNEQTERYKKLFSNECKTCTINKLHNVSKTLFFTDISEKTAPAMFESYAKFFNKDSILVEN